MFKDGEDHLMQDLENAGKKGATESEKLAAINAKMAKRKQEREKIEKEDEQAREAAKALVK